MLHFLKITSEIFMISKNIQYGIHAFGLLIDNNIIFYSFNQY